jgi:uncharacterized membrane protein
VPSLPSAGARPVYAVAVVALIAAGFFARGWGVLPVPLDFWADEAWWATLLSTGEFERYAFRPVGYMWLCQMLLELGSAELMLRLPSLVAGCAALICLWKCAEWSTRSRAAVIFVLVLAAFHPKLVVFAKEFKPYGVEIFVVSALTLGTLYCMRRGRGRIGLVIAALAALPLCYPAVFLYPGIAIALAGERLAALSRTTARQWAYGALVAVPVIASAHLYLFERLGAGASRRLWGEKYDVFPVDAGLSDGLAWYLEKSWSLMTLPGALEAMPAFAIALFGIGYAGGIAVLARARRWRELALLAGPLVTVMVANLLGYWPYGAFRANLFLVPGALLVTAQSVDWLAQRAWGRWLAWSLIAATLVVAVSGGAEPYRGKRSVHWAAAPQLTAVLADIDRRRRLDATIGPKVILADWHSWRPIHYYLPRQPDLQDHVRLVRGPVADLARLESQIAAEIARARRERRQLQLWLVVTRLDAHAAIESSPLVARHAVYRREFATGDRDYHPILIELEIDAPPDLLAAAAQRYHPRPRATAP